MTESGQKLVVMIVADSDADRLVRKLLERGHPATKIGSTSGLLRRGNTTILSGVDGEDVDALLAIVRAECRARTEYVPLQAVPFFGEGVVMADPVEVRVGGAVIFVLNVERFEKT